MANNSVLELIETALNSGQSNVVIEDNMKREIYDAIKLAVLRLAEKQANDRKYMKTLNVNSNEYKDIQYAIKNRKDILRSLEKIQKRLCPVCQLSKEDLGLLAVILSESLNISGVNISDDLSSNDVENYHKASEDDLIFDDLSKLDMDCYLQEKSSNHICKCFSNLMVNEENSSELFPEVQLSEDGFDLENLAVTSVQQENYHKASEDDLIFDDLSKLDMDCYLQEKSSNHICKCFSNLMVNEENSSELFPEVQLSEDGFDLENLAVTSVQQEDYDSDDDELMKEKLPDQNLDDLFPEIILDDNSSNSDEQSIVPAEFVSSDSESEESDSEKSDDEESDNEESDNEESDNEESYSEDNFEDQFQKDSFKEDKTKSSKKNSKLSKWLCFSLCCAKKPVEK